MSKEEKALKENLDQFISMVNEAKICMMITEEVDEENLSGRPMTISHVDEEGAIWFFTKETLHWVDELEEKQMISLAIINESSSTYMMIHGKATLTEDKEKMKELWSPVLKAWYPKGLEDPDIILLKITPDEVRYWEGSSSRMVLLFKMAKAIATGEQFDGGESGELKA